MLPASLEGITTATAALAETEWCEIQPGRRRCPPHPFRVRVWYAAMVTLPSGRRFATDLTARIRCLRWIGEARAVRALQPELADLVERLLQTGWEPVASRGSALPAFRRPAVRAG